MGRVFTEDFYEAITANNCSSAVAVTVGDGQGFAPPDEPAFNVRMVGVRLNAGSFYVEFVSDGHFIESRTPLGQIHLHQYRRNAGTLVLTYDDERTFGGNCTVQLTYDSPSEGAWSYTWRLRHSRSWRLAYRGGWTEIFRQRVRHEAHTREHPRRHQCRQPGCRKRRQRGAHLLH